MTRSSTTVVRAVGAIAAAASLAACGVIPHARTVDEPTKRAATSAQAASVLARFSLIRATAAKTADVGHLADAEAGSLLTVEGATYFASKALGVTPGAATLGGSQAVWSASFSRYPLWFATVAQAPAEQTQVATVFARGSSTEPWRAVMAPRLATDTDLPTVDLASDGSVTPVAGDDSAGLVASPTALVRQYADVLGNAKSRYAGEFEQDSFITQMRQLAAAQPTEHIDFTQRWTASPVQYALRLSDGGALVFADLHRVDTYRLEGRHALGFGGSAAEAYLPEPVHRLARLSYDHEVLLLVPAGGRALAIGQFGGLVGATGR